MNCFFQASAYAKSDRIGRAIFRSFDLICAVVEDGVDSEVRALFVKLSCISDVVYSVMTQSVKRSLQFIATFLLSD